MLIYPGDSIRLKAYDGEIVRTVVEVFHGSVAVCTEEEYAAASREKRAVVCVGFNIDDVVGVEHRTTTQSKDALLDATYRSRYERTTTAAGEQDARMRLIGVRAGAS